MLFFSQDCGCWPWFLKNRPVLRLFLVIAFNGLVRKTPQKPYHNILRTPPFFPSFRQVSMMCGAIFIELERPAQVARMERRERLTREVEVIRRNLTRYAFRTRIIRGTADQRNLFI